MTEAIPMKCRYIALLAVLATAVIALPAAAAEKERIGARLALFPAAPATFAANQPFHIAHGWLVTPDSAGQNAIGKYDFVLEVDGRSIDPDFVERVSTDGQLRRSWVFNFPAGLPAGTHTFAAAWSGPCQGLVDSGLHTGTCANPTELVVAGAPLWQAVEFTPSGPAPPVVGSRPFTWDPVRDWLRAPAESNPSPDSYGNAAVWSYRGSNGFEHDPASYTLLPRYSVPDANREEWNDPGFINLIVGRIDFDRAILMHSWGGREFGFGRNAVLAWTSPVGGRVTVRGEVRLVHTACTVGSGIIWSVDRGSESLQTTILPAGGSTTFDLAITVRKGETVYFIHDPGFDSNCDSAFVTVSISKP
jgi:hypothetical protein